MSYLQFWISVIKHFSTLESLIIFLQGLKRLSAVISGDVNRELLNIYITNLIFLLISCGTDLL